jgi:hypothetical protein
MSKSSSSSSSASGASGGRATADEGRAYCCRSPTICSDCCRSPAVGAGASSVAGARVALALRPPPTPHTQRE